MNVAIASSRECKAEVSDNTHAFDLSVESTRTRFSYIRNMKQVEQLGFAQVDVSVDCVVFGYNDDGLKVLLIDQKRPDTPSASIHKLYKALPGDLILEQESFEDAANRVLYELTRLRGIFLQQFQLSF